MGRISDRKVFCRPQELNNAATSFYKLHFPSLNSAAITCLKTSASGLLTLGEYCVVFLQNKYYLLLFALLFSSYVNFLVYCAKLSNPFTIN